MQGRCAEEKLRLVTTCQQKAAARWVHIKHAGGQLAAPGKLCKDHAQCDGYRYSLLRAGDFQTRNRDKLFM